MTGTMTFHRIAGISAAALIPVILAVSPAGGHRAVAADFARPALSCPASLIWDSVSSSCK